jgi:protein-tyrosine phosphatase
VIDLHCHLLPGIDDGAPDIETSIAMARAAVGGGVEAIVATPHVSGRYPNEPLGLAGRVEAVQRALDEAQVPLRVHTGAEIASSMFHDLDEPSLAACALGGGRYVLLEPPLAGPAPFIERMVFEMGLRGVNVVLAHPERIQAFQRDIDLVERLVAQGAVCSVTAMSAAGRFGGSVQRFTHELFSRGLVHNLASDAHDAAYRSPALGPVLEKAAAALPGLDEHLGWLTDAVPRAIVGGELVSGEPPRLEPRRSVLGRLRRRS